jgi:glycosyltransferase involved in cell wall biosynthesis
MKRFPKRKIALISEHASPIARLGGEDFGGQNVYVNHLSLALARLGYEVDVFTRQVSAEEPKIHRWVRGVRVVNLKAGPLITLKKDFLLPYMREFLNSFLTFCKTEGSSYDLVHANFWMSGLVAMEIKKILGTPFVVTFHALGRIKKRHQGQADTSPNERIPIERLVMREADKIIAECPQEREDLINLYGVSTDKLEIIPAGVDTKVFYPISKTWARRRLGLSPRENIVLCLGRMVRRKGVEEVIRAVYRLGREKGFLVRLLVVGGESDKPDPKLTPEIGRLAQVVKSLKLEDQVIFVGRKGVPLSRYYYNAADVFVSTPWYEPFGLTPLEAMACGCPVIGSGVGGIKYTVKENQTGFLVPPQDDKALADKLFLLLRDKKLQLKFGKKALENIYERFTWNAVGISAAALYEKVISPIEEVEVSEDQLDYDLSPVYFSQVRRKR